MPRRWPLSGMLRPTGMAPQSPGPGFVDTFAIGANRDTIVALGGAAREHAVADVAQDRFRRASERIAPATASRRVSDDACGGQATHAVLGWYKGFAACRLDGLQAHATVPATFDAEPRDGIEPLGPERPGAGHQDIELVSHAGAATPQAGASCVGAKLPPFVSDRKELLVKLKVRQVEATEGDQMAHLRKTVALSRRSRRAHGVPLVHDPARAVRVLGGYVTMGRFGPAGAGAIGYRLCQRSPDGVHDLMRDEHRVHGHRRRRLGIHDRAFGRNDRYTAVCAFIARDRRVEE